jgi:hypothetical protein
MHILAVAFSTEHRVWVRVLALSGWNTEHVLRYSLTVT